MAAGLGFALAVAHVAASDGFAFDAHAYWLASGYGALGNTPSEAPDAFLYSPPVLLTMRAVSAVIPWPVFLEIYSLMIGAGVWALAGPLTPFVIFTPQVASEVTLANIHVFLALMAVAGRRWPALWAFGLLTKVAPGVIGTVWFAARGEWRKAAIPIVVAAAISLPTMVLFPDLWAGWMRVLTESPPGGLVYRAPLAVVLTVIAARRDWPWALPVTTMLMLPVLWDVHGLSMLLGVVWFAWTRFPSWLPR